MSLNVALYMWYSVNRKKDIQQPNPLRRPPKKGGLFYWKEARKMKEWEKMMKEQDAINQENKDSKIEKE